jgi:hypothetical protein
MFSDKVSWFGKIMYKIFGLGDSTIIQSRKHIDEFIFKPPDKENKFTTVCISIKEIQTVITWGNKVRKKTRLYKVSAQVNGFIQDKSLEFGFKEPVYFPRLLPFWFSNRLQKRALVSAFIDIALLKAQKFKNLDESERYNSSNYDTLV